jgi:hypothetical protein
MYSKIQTTGRSPLIANDWRWYLPDDLTTEDERSKALLCAGSQRGLDLLKSADDWTMTRDWNPMAFVDKELGADDRNYANSSAEKYICAKLIDSTRKDVKKFCEGVGL